MSEIPPISFAVIGLGSAGLRFLRSFISISNGHASARIVGLADRDVRRLRPFAQLGVPTSQDFRTILDSKRVDLIVVATSETEHFEVISHLKQNTEFARILCEKPLAATVDEARRLHSALAENELTINFVERHSLAVDHLRDHMRKNGLKVVRANFSWGKGRIRDPRPTLGVISEIAHAIDVILFVAEVKAGTEYDIVHAFGVRSNFASCPSVFDSIHLGVRFAGELLVTGSSSYVRTRRERLIELFLAESDRSVCEIAVLRFDDPLWDDDRLEIYEISGTAPQAALS